MPSFTSLCGSPLWNSSLTWNTTTPEFTHCFNSTILIWVPCAFLWLLLPFEFRRAHSSKSGPTPWCGINVTKLVLQGVLILLAFGKLVCITQYNQKTQFYSTNTLGIVSVVVELITYALLFLVILYSRWKGIRVSLLVPAFWFFWGLSQCVLVYTIILHQHTEWYNPYQEAEGIITMVTCLAVWFQLIFSNFSEPATQFQRLLSDGVYEEACAFKKNSLFSVIAFSWANKVMYEGFKNRITMDNLKPVCKDMSSRKVTVDFDAAYEKSTKVVYVQDPILTTTSLSIQSSSSSSSKEEEKKAVKSVSVIKALWATSFKHIMLGNLMELLTTLLNFVPPFMLKKMLDFITSNEVDWHGYLYGIAFCGGTLLANLSNSLSEYFFMVASVQVKSSLISAIYRKILRINSTTKKSYMAGEIVNLMAIDTQELFEFVLYLPHIWSVPLRLTLTMYFLWQYLGPACLASLVVIGILIPLSIFLGRVIDKYQDEIMTRKDKRMKQMSEIMNGIKVLKLYAWERPFMKKVNDTRNEELVALKRSLNVDCFFSFLWIVAPFVICSACFTAFVLSDDSHTLTAETAFVSLALFNLLRFPMGVLPDLITRWVKATVSNRRLIKFLTSGETDMDTVGSSPKEGATVTFQNASLSWCDGEDATLKGINLSIPKGSLVAIVGPVGCGKSSLLCSLLGEMHRVQGQIDITGTMAYVPQMAWIQNATLQQNVIFTKSMNEQRYNKVISSCSLRPDIELLPGGDMTEIGEKGINLSGGQKQRISLARAVYQDADVYLLDDPLSAVDAHVAAELFKNVVGPTGMLKRKTRIIATHNISFLSEVDMVVVIADGEILEKGHYDELMAADGHLAKFIQQHAIGDTNKNNNNGSKRKLVDKQVSVLSNDSEAPVETEELYRLTEEEAMASGNVKWGVYLSYFKDMGMFIFFLTFLMNIFSAVCDIGSGVWLSQWTDNSMGFSPISGVGIFASFVFGQSIAVFLCYFFLFIGTVRASFKLHDGLLTSVMQSPLSFFDTTPTGRILNRFSKDIDSADSSVPFSLGNFLITICWLPGIIIIIAINSAYLLILLVPMLILYFFILKTYIHTSNHLRRLDSVSRSPVYSNFTETIQGVASIRAYAAQKFFIQRSNQRVDENLKCYYYSQVTSRWLDSSLSIMAAVIVLGATVLAVLERDNLSAGILGLALTYCIELTAGLNWTVRIGAFLEQNIVGVERIKEYSILQPEAPWEIEETKPSRFWPESGEIEISQFSTRYREGLDLVLKDVNLSIPPGTKVGVVGRTGAGKSSLILSLFRIVEPASGRISIDGVDISEIGVHDLRSKLTVIPQDPVLFAGSLRMNLDPWEEHTDEAVWKTLEQSHLKKFVTGLSEGLQHVVSEGGENLSAGQRQLVCLARALLRRTKVLVLDEATASVDLDTDNLIQETVRDAFADCTVITIAHRLNTILKCNKVIVFSQGHLVEEGSPDDLLSKPSSNFYSMARDAGLV